MRFTILLVALFGISALAAPAPTSPEAAISERQICRVRFGLILSAVVCVFVAAPATVRAHPGRRRLDA
ncbi:hypothetical protein F5882DRAFT_470966 [Hyaloscypha sp. PMI_1271]|nr:hypothetical protein F5882DRAFT_470966 [Hyaloscypha sp. PMI_1271]